MATGTPKPPSKAAFHQKVDREFYAEVAKESGGKLPADLTDALGEPRKLTTSPADAAYRKKWKDIAAKLRESKAVPEKEVTSSCIPCALKALAAKIAAILLPSKSTGKPINVGTPGPLTGNPPYEPDRWNEPNIQDSTNCYAYAANDPDGHPVDGTTPQPGEHCGHPSTGTSCAEVSRGALCDGMIAAPDPPPPKAGYYPVALVSAPDYDYHWYRLDSNGKWSHKRGTTEAQNLDASGKLITDPKTANRNYGEGNYKDFCGYFYVPSAGLRTGNP